MLKIDRNDLINMKIYAGVPYSCNLFLRTVTSGIGCFQGCHGCNPLPYMNNVMAVSDILALQGCSIPERTNLIC